MAKLTWTIVAFVGIAAMGVAAWRANAPESLEDRPLQAFETPQGAMAYPDRENFYAGPYIAYAGDWSVTSSGLELKRGVDYRDVIFVRRETFPNGVDIRWQWPMKPPPTTGVYGYMHIAYGYYAGGIAQQQVPARQVSDVKELTTQFAVETTNLRGDFNLLSETFLTSQPRDFKSKILEVGFLTRVSDEGRTFFEQGHQVGLWRDPSGRAWRVAKQGDYCMFLPAEGEVTDGVLDYGAAFRWLMAKGELTGREWFNGLAIGVEPVKGEGSLRLKTWKVTYPS